MSYSIIFETIFIKLSDGRLLHLERSGCNNDNAGRSREDFYGTVYTAEALNNHINGYLEVFKDSRDAFELKIGNQRCSFYQYGEHLFRMAKRAKPYDEFCAQRYFEATKFDGIELLEPEKKILTPDEFEECFNDHLYSGEKVVYRRLITKLNTENEIIEALDKKETVSFYIGKSVSNRKIS
jgi:hypothetical protein